MSEIYKIYSRVLDGLVVLCMLTMLILVFLNVVLRMGFNSGIDCAEEVPRFAFVWMAFLGGVIGMQKRSHLGVDMIVRKLPCMGKKICWIIGQCIMLVCGYYILYGTWMQHDILIDNSSPVLQLSMIWVYGISYFTGGGIIAICFVNLIRLMLGNVTEEEFVDVQEEGVSGINVGEKIV